MRREVDVPRPRLAPVLAGLGFVAILAVALAGAAGRLRTIPAEDLAAARPSASAPALVPAPPPDGVTFVSYSVSQSRYALFVTPA